MKPEMFNLEERAKNNKNKNLNLKHRPQHDRNKRNHRYQVVGRRNECFSFG